MGIKVEAKLQMWQKWEAYNGLCLGRGGLDRHLTLSLSRQFQVWEIKSRQGGEREVSGCVEVSGGARKISALPISSGGGEAFGIDWIGSKTSVCSSVVRAILLGWGSDMAVKVKGVARLTVTISE
jgi:hypothetical protein